MSGRITILGCGSSGGVPRVGQGWGACDPNQTRNRRRRCSILLERMGGARPTTILVDASPDLREQLLATGTRQLDGVILTHDHADHTHGLDDLRPLTILNRARIDVFAHDETAQSMLSRFGYCFEARGGYPPILTMREVPLSGAFAVQGSGGAMHFETFPVIHGEVTVLGLKFKNIVYTPDVSAISGNSEANYEGLDLWIIDALRLTPHPTHFSLSEALEWIARMKPKRAVLTNLHTDLDYDTLRRELPDGIEPAYDGMVIEIA